ncbi:MAG: restriction endonuclease subunit M [Bacteroidaceae bacterium]|nr:restriction endonuclease subunit M [Bacteroidaceae bacterium]
MNNVDVLENDILQMYPDVLPELLRDHTTGRNIFWATDDYAELGEGYDFNSEITIEAITGEHEGIIKPRVLKPRENQKGRSKKMAEIFTPAWVCNLQINYVDEVWFDSPNKFNVMSEDKRTWKSTTEPVTFPEGKTWEDYIRSTRLEITCGEAPYIVSRYDAVTGEFIPLQERIGMLDRKIRLVNENTSTYDEWFDVVQWSYKNIYGYEWQGDSLLLARENLLVSFIEYYQARFNKMPSAEEVQSIAYIVSWNLLQMDGLKYVIPNSCSNKEVIVSEDLFGNKKKKTVPCEGCKKNNPHKHNGIYCKVMDWWQGKPIEFVSLLNKNNK